jgi:hypothetical protein
VRDGTHTDIIPWNLPPVAEQVSVSLHLSEGNREDGKTVWQKFPKYWVHVCTDVKKLTNSVSQRGLSNDIDSSSNLDEKIAYK